MENYTPDSLYNNLLGLSNSDNLKGKLEETYTMQDNYLEPLNNLVTEDGIYSLGMGAAPMNYVNQSPINGYQELSPMIGYANEPATDFQSVMFADGSLELPQDVTDMVNSLLIADQDFPVNGFEHDLDVNIDAGMAFDDDQDDGLFDLIGNSNSNSPYEVAPPSYETTMPQHCAVPPAEPTQRRRKTRKAKTIANALVEEVTASPSPLHMGYDPYPNPDLGVPSPASSSGYSDGCSSIEDSNGKPRQRRPRVSYSTLTEEEKYKRIRDLNNEASRHYRERQKGVLSTLEQQLPSLIEKNQHLKDKAAALERLRDQMKQYSNVFLRQHMSNTSNNGF